MLKTFTRYDSRGLSLVHDFAGDLDSPSLARSSGKLGAALMAHEPEGWGQPATRGLLPCLHCGAKIRDDATLCEVCQAEEDVAGPLEFEPIIANEPAKPTTRRVVFSFNEGDYVSIEKLREQGRISEQDIRLFEAIDPVLNPVSDESRRALGLTDGFCSERELFCNPPADLINEPVIGLGLDNLCTPTRIGTVTKRGGMLCATTAYDLSIVEGFCAGLDDCCDDPPYGPNDPRHGGWLVGRSESGSALIARERDHLATIEACHAIEAGSNYGCW